MFAQYVIVLLLLIAAGWILWRYFISSALDIHHGKATQAKKRAQQKLQEAADLEAEADAAKLEADAKKKIVKFKNKIRFYKKK